MMFPPVTPVSARTVEVLDPPRYDQARLEYTIELRLVQTASFGLAAALAARGMPASAVLFALAPVGLAALIWPISGGPSVTVYRRRLS